MSRAERLLALIQCLRRHRQPVSGQTLATELGISLRTLYRDIASLQAQGASIDGEPGVGYVLRPGFMLPPLMFSEEELEALLLGSRWVAERADARLGAAARNAMARIGAVPVLGLPGCVRTPKLNGCDWVMQRLLAGLDVSAADIRALGIGGLLAEIPSRPQPRESRQPSGRPRIAAIGRPTRCRSRRPRAGASCG